MFSLRSTPCQYWRYIMRLAGQGWVVTRSTCKTARLDVVATGVLDPLMRQRWWLPPTIMTNHALISVSRCTACRPAIHQSFYLTLFIFSVFLATSVLNKRRCSVFNAPSFLHPSHLPLFYFFPSLNFPPFPFFIQFRPSLKPSTHNLQCESKKIPPEIFGSATLTKLCHIKRNHHNLLKMCTIDRNALNALSCT